jgi:hypothetical protein
LEDETTKREGNDWDKSVGGFEDADNLVDFYPPLSEYPPSLKLQRVNHGLCPWMNGCREGYGGFSQAPRRRIPTEAACLPKI